MRFTVRVALGATWLASIACGALVELEPASQAPGDAGVPDGRGPRPDREEDDAPPERPSRVPDGWGLYSEFRQACGFYVPSTRDVMPKPIAWEPCGVLSDAGTPGPPGMVCSRMVTDWEPSADGHHLGETAVASAGADGKLRLAFHRIVGGDLVVIIADADGPVHSAMLQTGPCVTERASLSRTHFIFGVRADVHVRSGGAIGGSIGDLRPTVYRPYRYLEDTYKHFIAGDGLFVEDRTTDEVHAFDGGGLVGEVADGSITYVASGQDFFFERGSTHIMSWTSTEGTRSLIDTDGDFTRASTGFGTDGVDMVWLEAFERISSTQFARQETWTAKHTTDPAVARATKRRVRATEREYGYSYVVGCGYAATLAVTGEAWGQHGVRITRLSDGVSWNVVDNSPEQMLELHILKPIALTCDEVFVAGASKGRHQIMRIRLDSLGPGVPPT